MTVHQSLNINQSRYVEWIPDGELRFSESSTQKIHPGVITNNSSKTGAVGGGNGKFQYKSVSEKEPTINVNGAGEAYGQETIVDVHSRIIVQPSSGTLKLDETTPHGKSFNEMVRRIKSDKQKEIMFEISQIKDEEIAKLEVCCQRPDEILTTYIDFFASDNTPYIAIKAFRNGEINKNQFSTIVSLHASYLQDVKHDESVSLHFMSLFDSAGIPNENAWQNIKETIDKSNRVGQVFRFDTEAVLEKMLMQFQGVSPIESGYWYSSASVHDQDKLIIISVRLLGAWALSGDDDTDMMPSVTLRQSFIESAFGDEAHKINPVIGISTPDDLADGARRRVRDFALPFPGHPLPKEADSLPAPRVLDFQIHDFYHALRSSELKNRDVAVFLDIGDALRDQKKRYHQAVDALINLCKGKLSSYASFKKQLDKMSPEARVKAEVRLKKAFYAVVKLIGYLKACRKATGSLKAAIYDMEIPGSDYHHKEEKSRNNLYNFYCKSCVTLLRHLVEKRKGTSLLEGLPVKLAGRVVFSVINKVYAGDGDWSNSDIYFINNWAEKHYKSLSYKRKRVRCEIEKLRENRLLKSSGDIGKSISALQLDIDLDAKEKKFLNMQRELQFIQYQ